MDKFTLFSEETLLLIIDIQERLAPAMKYGERVIKNTGILVSMAKEMNMPILVTEQYPKGLGSTVAQLRAKLQDTPRLEKIAFSACREEILGDLRERKRKKIIVTGMETHVCVFQTVRDLLELNYEVFLVSDGISSRFKDDHRIALDLMKDMGAVITNTEIVLFDLLKKAGTPEFKNLSKLIR